MCSFFIDYKLSFQKKYVYILFYLESSLAASVIFTFFGILYILGFDFSAICSFILFIRVSEYLF